MARTRTRRRTRRRKTGLLDRLMVAGIIGGGLYMVLHQALAAPPKVAAVLALVAFGLALGSFLPTVRWRSPIVWRRR